MFSNIVIPPPAPQKSKAYPITDPQVLVLCVIAPEKPRKISFSGRGFEAVLKLVHCLFDMRPVLMGMAFHHCQSFMPADSFNGGQINIAGRADQAT